MLKVRVRTVAKAGEYNSPPVFMYALFKKMYSDFPGSFHVPMLLHLCSKNRCTLFSRSWYLDLLHPDTITGSTGSGSMAVY